MKLIDALHDDPVLGKRYVSTQAATVRLGNYVQFGEIETFARFGARLDEDTRSLIVHGRRIRECLKQPELSSVSVPARIAILLALSADLFDRVLHDHMRDAQRVAINAVASIPAEASQRLVSIDKLSAEDRDRHRNTRQA